MSYSLSYVLNFDIFFAIAFVGMVFSAFFTKSRKYSNNFFLFLLVAVVLGVLVYFDIDKKLIETIGGSLQPMFANSVMAKIFNKPYYYGLYYFLFLLVSAGVIFLVIKLLISLFMIERRKYKKDLTYTPKHHGMVSFLTSILKFAFFLEVLLIVFAFVQTRFGFDISGVGNTNYIIKYFNEWEEPVINFLKDRGAFFFGKVGY